MKKVFVARAAPTTACALLAKDAYPLHRILNTATRGVLFLVGRVYTRAGLFQLRREQAIPPPPVLLSNFGVWGCKLCASRGRERGDVEMLKGRADVEQGLAVHTQQHYCLTGSCTSTLRREVTLTDAHVRTIAGNEPQDREKTGWQRG
eukprot:1146009-Pelagomonas_calceolata.AAC.1